MDQGIDPYLRIRQSGFDDTHPWITNGKQDGIGFSLSNWIGEAHRGRLSGTGEIIRRILYSGCAERLTLAKAMTCDQIPWW